MNYSFNSCEEKDDFYPQFRKQIKKQNVNKNIDFTNQSQQVQDIMNDRMIKDLIKNCLIDHQKNSQNKSNQIDQDEFKKQQMMFDRQLIRIQDECDQKIIDYKKQIDEQHTKYCQLLRDKQNEIDHLHQRDEERERFYKEQQEQNQIYYKRIMGSEYKIQILIKQQEISEDVINKLKQSEENLTAQNEDLVEQLRRKTLILEEHDYKRQKELQSQKINSENIRNGNALLIQKQQEDYDRLNSKCQRIQLQEKYNDLKNIEQFNDDLKIQISQKQVILNQLSDQKKSLMSKVFVLQKKCSQINKIYKNNVQFFKQKLKEMKQYQIQSKDQMITETKDMLNQIQSFYNILFEKHSLVVSNLSHKLQALELTKQNEIDEITYNEKTKLQFRIDSILQENDLISQENDKLNEQLHSMQDKINHLKKTQKLDNKKDLITNKNKHISKSSEIYKKMEQLYEKEKSKENFIQNY